MPAERPDSPPAADAHESEEIFRRLIELSPESVCVHRDGLIRFANPACVQLLRAGRAEALVGKSILDRIHPEDRDKVLQRIRRTLDTGASAPLVEERMLRMDGSSVSIEASNVVVPFEGERSVLVVGRDITSRKQAEEQLQNVQRLKSLGVLAGGIAHDFKNLLAGIYGQVELSLGDLKEQRVSSAIERLEQVSEVFDRARHLTHQLLTFAKGGAPARRPGDLSRAVQSSVRFALSGSNVRSEVALGEALWPCSFDANQLAQVIDNLVINAKEAMPEGGLLRVKIENYEHPEEGPAPLGPGRYLRISVADEGQGIPEEILPHVFDPFFTTKPGGTGLGLATSWSIAQRHGGHIAVESTPGGGATFHLYLPSGTGTTPVERSSMPMPTSAGARILVMDDEEFIRKMLVSMLARGGYVASTAADGEEAAELVQLACLEGRPFGAALLDLTVPGGLGGREIVARLASLDPRMRIIASSGYADDPVMARPADYGFAASLAKPYHLHELLEVLAVQLAGSAGSSAVPATGA
jgi:PAS domain S-box-containing protein